MIDANPHEQPDLHRDRRKMGIAVSVVLNPQVRSLRCHFSKTQVNLNKHPYHLWRRRASPPDPFLIC